jgi:hypothetical protein
MQLTSEHIARIRHEFAVMSTKEEFVALLNYAKECLIGEHYKPFELKQITYYANPKVSGRRFKKFEIKKKSGGIRTIHSPVKGLSAIQRCLNIILQCVFTPHDAAKGFVQGKSIVDNAKIHVGRKYVYNIDLKDFFPSIDQARIWKCLQLPPFNLTGSNQMQIISRKVIKDKVNELIKAKGIIAGRHSINAVVSNLSSQINSGRLQLANIIASLCCTEMVVERSIEDTWQKVTRNVLPQGAATSPVLTNIVCQRLDFLLTGVAKRFGLKYTRYADDITFSSNHNVFKEDGEFIKELKRIIAQQGFHIKASKVRLQDTAYRQEVTGLIVNRAVNVPRDYIKQLRMWLYNWERYDYDRAYSYFLPSYLTSKTTPVKGKPDMANVIGGKLHYLKMVKGENNEMYLKLKERFDILVNSPITKKPRAGNHLDIVLHALVNEGLDKAMSIYKHS